MVTTFVFILPLLLLYALVVIYAERKIAGFIQDRLGPMETGPYGLLQTVADIIKLLQKEDIIAHGIDRVLFKLAPAIIFTAVIGGFAVVPLAANWPGASFSSAMVYLLAIVSLDVIGIIMAGWSSNNKYAMLGTIRSAAQLISYEVPLGLSVLVVCMAAGTMDLQEISAGQGTSSPTPQYLFDAPALGADVSQYGGFLAWNVIRLPYLFIAWIIFFIASLAECNRAPFDLPEAESELVAGFQTEYSGVRFTVIMLAEYGMMLLVSILAAILFFGSWNSPLPDLGPVKLSSWTSGSVGSWTATAWGIFWLLSKAFFFVFLQIWVRWTYPRLRIDQLMNLSWKFLTPLGLLLVIICGSLKILFA